MKIVYHSLIALNMQQSAHIYSIVAIRSVLKMKQKSTKTNISMIINGCKVARLSQRLKSTFSENILQSAGPLESLQ